MGMRRILAFTSVFLGLVACALAGAQDAQTADLGDTTPPTVTRTVPASGAPCANPTANVSAFFSEDMKGSSVNGTTFKLYRTGATTKVGASVSYNATIRKGILNPTNPLRGGVTYKAVVTTYVTDLADNRLDQDATRTGLQRKAWTFTASTDSVTAFDCEQAAARSDLEKAATAANACAADNNGFYTNCGSVAQLQPYGFNPTTGVVVNGMDSNLIDWSASMQHASGGSAYTYANFGENAGQVMESTRGTDAPALPDRVAEWNAIARGDLESAVSAASACATDNGGSYFNCGSAAQLKPYGFTQTINVTYANLSATTTYWVATTSHSYSDGTYYQYDTRTGQIECFGTCP
ncbi:MAG: Ig-like domain-containing protein [Rubrobacter sp.]|nr:Ig-like domain-containing protein [Rubrobacter sp.]